MVHTEKHLEPNPNPNPNHQLTSTTSTTSILATHCQNLNLNLNLNLRLRLNLQQQPRASLHLLALITAQSPYRELQQDIPPAADLQTLSSSNSLHHLPQDPYIDTAIDDRTLGSHDRSSSAPTSIHEKYEAAYARHQQLPPKAPARRGAPVTHFYAVSLNHLCNVS
eukprot:jgi/Hompol1/5308/HPOL_004316-RA